jgi:cellobiose phosphorylase
MYQAAIEYIFGLKVTKDYFTVTPCIPSDWKDASLTYRRGNTTYVITLDNPNGREHGVASITLDGQPVLDGKVVFTQDGQTHQVRVLLG